MSNDIKENGSPFARSDKVARRRSYDNTEYENKSPKVYYKLVLCDHQKSDAEEQPPEILEQKKKIKETMKDFALKLDEVWFLIDKKWYEKWSKYVNYGKLESTEPGGPHPGPISNISLLSEPEKFRTNAESGKKFPMQKLKYPLDENTEYTLLPSSTWGLLLEWYGGLHKGFAPTLARATYSQNPNAVSPTVSLDLYPLFIQGGMFDKKKHQFDDFRFPRCLTVKQVKKILKFEWKISDRKWSDSRLWAAFLGNPWTVLDEDALIKDLCDDMLKDRQLIVEGKKLGEHFELDNYRENDKIQGRQSPDHHAYRDRYKRTGGVFSGYGTRTRSRSYGMGSFLYSNTGEGGGSVPGVCGLRNLGNTCFMNSGLQCLTKTRAFRDFFTSGRYQNEINKDNPLGMNGDVAQSFGDLMSLMWSGDNSVIAPRHFKSTIGRYNHTFAGYHQQDSHELIAFLLDGIHEDLNRVKKKPQTYTVEGKGRADKIVAEESWQVHKRRNDSVIVDTFQGQLKSKVVCPNCDNISITFDPYMYLSVPIPGKKKVKIDLTLFHLNNRKPRMVYRFEYPVGIGKTFEDLRKDLASLSGLPPKKLWFVEADTYGGGIREIWEEDAILEKLNSTDSIHVYETRAEFDLCELKERNEKLKLVSSLDHFPFGVVNMKIHPETDDPRIMDMDDEEEKDESSSASFQETARQSHMKDKDKKYTHDRDRYSSYRSSFREIDVTHEPYIVQLRNHETNGKELYLEILELVKNGLHPDARKLILERTKGKIDIERPETCFPMATEEMREQLVKFNEKVDNVMVGREQKLKEMIEKHKKKRKDKDKDGITSSEDEEDVILPGNDLPPLEETLTTRNKSSKKRVYERRKNQVARDFNSENLMRDEEDQEQTDRSLLPGYGDVDDAYDGEEDALKQVSDDHSEDPLLMENPILSEQNEGNDNKMKDEEEDIVLKQDVDAEDEEKKNEVIQEENPDKMKDEEEESDGGQLPEEKELQDEGGEDSNISSEDWYDGAESPNDKIGSVTSSDFGGDKRKKAKERIRKKRGLGRSGVKKRVSESESQSDSEELMNEPDFSEPLHWKKWLFTIEVAREYDSRPYNPDCRNIYFEESQRLHIHDKKLYYKYYSRNVEGPYCAYVKVMISDIIDEELLNLDSYKKDVDHESIGKLKEQKRRSGGVDLNMCIEKFCEREKLTKDNSWYCRQCKEHVEATKKMDIWKLPKVLVFQLKRFSTGRYGYREKIGKYVHYPHMIDMEQYTINKENKFKKYRLYAVSNHFGGLGGGHYTAYAAAPNERIDDKVEDYQWYNFDDSSANRTSEKDVQARSGYVLFYEAVEEEQDEEEEKKKLDTMKDEEDVQKFSDNIEKEIEEMNKMEDEETEKKEEDRMDIEEEN